jgi:hypothetical protein
MDLDREEGRMKSQLEKVPAVSRRRFMQTAAIGAAGVMGSLTGPVPGVAHGDDFPRDCVVPPKPVPGGVQIPDGPQIHVWAPGDPSVTLPFSGGTLMGFDVDPGTITDFQGLSAAAFHAGTAVGSDGATYNLETDLRAYKGAYIAADGRRRVASFAFI